MFEIWRSGGSNITTSPSEARAVEAEGWDGQMFMDSQSLSLDPYVMMGLWAGATERLKLSTGVTNPHTRHIAVIAGCAASVQAVSGGRAVLGIGRGDSALAYLGLAPVGLAAFERALHDLQVLLRRESLPFDPSAAGGEAPSLDVLSLGARPEGTSLRWLAGDLPKVPLDVAATGPKVIEMAAPIAERLTFSVGAIPERIDWAIALARAARARQGLTDQGISYGAQLLVYCHRDADTALEAAARAAPPLARFQVIQSGAAGPQNANDAANFEAIRKNYDMTTHGVTHAKSRLMGMKLDADFVRRFAIAGAPEQCIERLIDLARRGLDRLVCVGPAFYSEAWGEDRHLFAREVMPALRAELGASKRPAPPGA
ncbi:MAG TPA: LLM class flavin-dependent oxidoreductase [Steroidobacteraceae bacterium]|nr:LLM class flavin-dependent oxidoreductase [Steroidobacteraceae bacterium]